MCRTPHFCLSCDSKCSIAFCEQSSPGLPSGLILAEAPFLSGWACGFATWQTPAEDDWPALSGWLEDLAWVIPHGWEACQSAGSTELWASAGLGLKQCLCITHHPQKGISLTGGTVSFIKHLASKSREMFLSCSCFFLKRFPLTSLQVSFYSSNKEGFGSRKASMQ